MIEITEEHLKCIDEKNKYKLAFYSALGTIYILVSIMFFTIKDVYVQDNIISNNNKVIVELTTQVLQQAVQLSEAEDLLRILKDLDRDTN